ncbi:MAG: alpha/beta hydrolase, partial [Anaerolineaceae bacterium]|nr:alpha/beta hydrolase [Anaerolineaceae bacterium]
MSLRITRQTNHLSLHTLIIATLFILSGCQVHAASLSPSPTVSPAPNLTRQPCHLGINTQAECIVLPVLEDRSSGNGRKINLAIVRIPARNRSAQPDPVFLLAGGPGQAATQVFLPILSAFTRINQERDLVMVDQRGTGSSGALNCPNRDDSASLSIPNPSPAIDLQRLKDCAQTLTGDARNYTTATTVQDLDEVRQALGFDQINLIGVSYGTRLALEYLRTNPGRVRSLVLDGVVPPDWPLGVTASADAQQALDHILQRCQEQPGCRQVFPDLPRELRNLIQTLTDQPPLVAIPNPNTGAPIHLLLTRNRAATTLQILSYTQETAALLPLLIHNAAGRDFAGLAAQFMVVNQELQGSIAEGLYYSIVCAEDVPFYPQNSTAISDSYLPDSKAELADACSVWPHAAPRASLPQPVSSNAPVLLLSGEDDPITPPANAQQVANNLPNSLALVAPGMGHNVINR